MSEVSSDLEGDSEFEKDLMEDRCWIGMAR